MISKHAAVFLDEIFLFKFHLFPYAAVAGCKNAAGRRRRGYHGASCVTASRTNSTPQAVACQPILEPIVAHRLKS